MRVIRIGSKDDFNEQINILWGITTLKSKNATMRKRYEYLEEIASKQLEDHCKDSLSKAETVLTIRSDWLYFLKFAYKDCFFDSDECGNEFHTIPLMNKRSTKSDHKLSVAKQCYTALGEAIAAVLFNNVNQIIVGDNEEKYYVPDAKGNWQ